LLNIIQLNKYAFVKIFFFISSSGGARCFCEDAGLLSILHQPVQYRSSTSLSYISYNIKDGSQIGFWAGAELRGGEGVDRPRRFPQILYTQLIFTVLDPG